MSTLDRTIARGEPDERGWSELRYAPGEPTIGGLEDPEEVLEPLACLVHLTDLHICDAESPARLEYLDRWSDPDSPIREEVGHVGGYRPQEILTLQVADAMVRTVNEITAGPITGAAVSAVLLTGDVTDNAQTNELGWYRSLLTGGTVAARSGSEEVSSWVGVSDPQTWDERYWHPDGPPAGLAEDRPTAIEGLPRCPGVIEAARSDFATPGLRYPWISVYGNHDGLIQGTLPLDERAREFVVGDERITGLAPGRDPVEFNAMNAMVGPAEYILDPFAPRTTIPADDRRRFVERDDFCNATEMDALYGVVDVGAIRLVYLNTVNENGGWQGSLDVSQFEWLKEQLFDNSDKYTVIASHHPSPTMINDYAPGGASRRILGDEVVSELLRHDHVIAWIAGHVHFHAALSHQRPGSEAPHFWEITTSSLIDWPQQGRILELVRGNGRVGIASTAVDHGAPVDWRAGLSSGWTPENMASLSRALSANDCQIRADQYLKELRDGNPEVRNRMWWLPDRLAINHA